MNRRNLLRNGLFATAGATMLGPLAGIKSTTASPANKGKRAKNIIFMVSDGMSQGTLTMADEMLMRRDGRHSNWIQMYRDNRLVRSMMDTSSASSIVTDSAAGGSAWGGGMRINNGALNVGPNGERPVPILQKFQKAGKAVGCVTTVPITHATPASFCINNNSRKGQPEIAAQYLPLKFDVMMGGGLEHFTAAGREDKRDLFQEFRDGGYAVALDKTAVAAADTQKPLLGVFYKDALPYTVDHLNSSVHKATIPTLAEMTTVAIDRMKNNPNGFVMQVEGGKVDWAAHGNDVAGLIFDQIAFDDAVKVAIDFAAQDGETLVIMTTDHGNANPGLFYGAAANDNFDRLARFTGSNLSVFNQLKQTTTPSQLIDLINASQLYTLTNEQATTLMSKISGLTDAELLDSYKLPFAELAMMQRPHTSVHFADTNHSSDYVELAAFGPGSELLKPFTINTDLHIMMLEAAEMPQEYFFIK